MSSAQARAYHSITIGGSKNTWDDWGLIPSSRPKFNTPTKKTNYVDIPGGDGTIDMSEVLTGYPVYNDREGSFEFYVVMDCAQNAGKSWKDIYEDMCKYLHGKIFTIKLDDDPDWYYEGMLLVKEWISNNDGSGSTVTIDYKVKPYKYYKNEKTVSITIPTDVSTGVAYDITNNLDIMPVSPTITSTNAIKMSYTDTDGSDTEIQLKVGTHSYNQITLSAVYRSVYLSFDGNSTVTLKYRNGRL